MAPSYANLFMAVVEDKILTTAPGGLTPEFYKMFIDDLLMVWLHGEASLLLHTIAARFGCPICRIGRMSRFETEVMNFLIFFEFTGILFRIGEREDCGTHPGNPLLEVRAAWLNRVHSRLL